PPWNRARSKECGASGVRAGCDFSNDDAGGVAVVRRHGGGVGFSFEELQSAAHSRGADFVFGTRSGTGAEFDRVRLRVERSTTGAGPSGLSRGGLRGRMANVS